jgi:RNA polymerase sigma factor (sigma-70 family)
MDTFSQHLNAIGQWPLLTPAQEIELAKLKQAGIETSERIGTRKPTRKESRIIKTGVRSAERMVLCNLRLVVSIAKGYVKHCNLHDIQDLVQYGTIGLQRAVDKFDFTKGYKFSTYATWWIKQEIQRNIYKTDRTIRLPEHSRLAWARLQKHTKRLGQKLERPPTSNEIMEAAGINQKDFDFITRAMTRMTSLNSLLETGNELIDNIADPSCQNEIAPDYKTLYNSMQALKSDDRSLLLRRFGFNDYPPHTYAELGKIYGVSRERARQRVEKAMNLVKRHLSAQEI